MLRTLTVADDTNITFRGFGGTTSRSYAAKDPSIKLRHRAIAFISAGSSTPQEQEMDETLIAAIELNDDDEHGEEEVPAQLDGAMDIEESTDTKLGTATQVISEQETLGFVVDTVGDDSAVSKQPHKTIDQLLQRAVSPALSDSSEEIILFQGRNRATIINDPPAQGATKTSSHSSTAEPSKEQPLCAWAGLPSRLSPNPQATTQSFTPVPDAFWRKSTARNVEEYVAQSKVPATSAPQQEEAQETIEMLQAAFKQAKKEKQANKAATRSQQPMPDDKISRRGKRGRKQSNRLLRNIDLEETDAEEAAYQDYMENLRSQELDGAQNEVLDAIPDAAENEQEWEDTEMTGADSEDSDEVIGEDLSDFLDEDDGLNASELDSSELEDELERAEMDILQAEEALHGRRMQSKSDADIARLWAKQLELGIDADELVIDDGDNLDLDGFGDVEAARAGFEEYIGLAGKRHKSTRSKRRGQDMSFPDASALADTIEQYGNEGFDIMDFDRPSLRPTKKGRKGKLPAELEALSDDELRDNMLNAWDNDRAKKRLKKAEREELRSQGLLGSLAKKGKADLGQKYQQGMTMEQVYEEIKVFLEDDGKTTQPFPPMDKENRKALHVVASALNLKSKSIGSGLTRYPVLYKTKNTLEVSDAIFTRIIQKSNRSFLKNQSWGGKKTSKPVKRSGGAGMGATGLRHGELVGAGAKELGKENFGHKLMEKMGWKQGQSLGRDGEGVLEPVQQMMRVGRAGLG